MNEAIRVNSVDETSSDKPPAYRRQRMLLYLLETSPNGLSKMDFQQLLLLYCKETESKHYEFVPYRYGGYSFQCANDLDVLEKQGWIETRDNDLFLSQKIDDAPWAKGSEEREKVRQWILQRPQRGDELVALTYRRYPYYALRSEMKERLLNGEEREKVSHSVNAVTSDEIVVFTLGYEGLRFEAWLNRLICNQVKTLCDVRHNPFSFKFGFTYQELSRILPKVDIVYEHFPELGISSEARCSLSSKADYDALFQKYRGDLSEKKKDLKRLVLEIESRRRVALTCFEANHQHCHRHCLSDYLENKYRYHVAHL